MTLITLNIKLDLGKGSCIAAGLTKFLTNSLRYCSRLAEYFGHECGVYLLFFRQGTVVSETKEFRRSYVREGGSRRQFHDVKIPLHFYLGTEAAPEWMDTKRGMSSNLLFTMSLLDAFPRRSFHVKLYHQSKSSFVCTQSPGLERAQRHQVLHRKF